VVTVNTEEIGSRLKGFFVGTKKAPVQRGETAGPGEHRLPRKTRGRKKYETLRGEIRFGLEGARKGRPRSTTHWWVVKTRKAGHAKPHLSGLTGEVRRKKGLQERRSKNGEKHAIHHLGE